MLVGVVGEAMDFCDLDALEGASPDGLLGDESEPAFHLIEP